MKNKITVIIFFVLLFISIFACNENSTEPTDEIIVKPVVINSSINYNQDTFNSSFPDTTSLNNISKTYSNNYSEELKIKILDYLKNKVIKLGEDANIIDSILSRTGFKLSGEYQLPTYAERAKYEDKDAWVFQVTYGIGAPNFGHYKCIVFSIENLDTLAFKQCR